jgi:hypothetical protein
MKKARNQMSNELNNAQCNAFQEQHVEVYCGFSKAHRAWFAYVLGEWRNGIKANSRQAAITAYWQKHHPEWKPPEIHDAEWALECIVKNDLHWGTCSEMDYTQVWTPDQRRISTTLKHIKTVDDIIKIVHQWMKEHDPDKVEPEVTAMELLREVVKADCTGLAALEVTINKVSDFLHGKKVEDDHD